MRHSRAQHIYRSQKHLLVTILAVALPVVLMLAFAEISNFAITKLTGDILISSGRLLLAYIIASVLAWVFAVTSYKGKRSVIALPFFDVLQNIPTFAALPFAILVFGRSDLTVIIFLVLAIIWPIFFSILSALKQIRRDWNETVEIAGLKGWAYIRYFLLPISLPSFVTGSIIGVGDGWEALIATEIVVSTQAGLGNFFNGASTEAFTTFFGMTALLLFIFIISKLIWLPLLEYSHELVSE